METEKIYDLIVIWSWWAGKIARPAAERWLNVAIIEKDKLWWTCLNRGCIPSKMLIHPADVMQEIREAKKYHISVNAPTVDFGKLVTEINTSTDSTSNKINDLYNSSKNETLDYFHGQARFLDNNRIEVNSQVISGKKIIIAVGARPTIPPIEWLEATPYMTSTEALRNKQLPKKLLVIWGWYIAVELGHAYGALGSNVTFIVRWWLIWNVDSEIKEEFGRVFKEKYNVLEWVWTHKVEYDKTRKEFTLYYTQNNEEKAIQWDALLIATGVQPNSDTLNLENTDITTNKRGFIEVDDTLQTSLPHIYALWDCIWNYLFRHSVNFEAEYLYKELIEDNNLKPKNQISYPPMPWAIFSNPQVAWVWKTEDELINEWVSYIKWINKYQDSAMWDALKSDHWIVKLLFDKTSLKLLWAHIIWVEASNMIHILIVFITMWAKLDDILNIIYIHPALPENVRNAARNAKKAIK